MREQRRQPGKSGGAVTPKVGVAWYRREQWDRLLEVSSDRDDLEDNYDEWMALAEETLGKLALQGLIVQKVDIDVEELLSWCRSKNWPVDAQARSEFVAAKLYKNK